MGRLKYRWKVCKYQNHYIVGCPLCGREYEVDYAEMFRCCPECGRQLCDRHVFTHTDLIQAEEERRRELLNATK